MRRPNTTSFGPPVFHISCALTCRGSSGGSSLSWDGAPASYSRGPTDVSDTRKNNPPPMIKISDVKRGEGVTSMPLQSSQQPLTVPAPRPKKGTNGP